MSKTRFFNFYFLMFIGLTIYFAPESVSAQSKKPYLIKNSTVIDKVFTKYDKNRRISSSALAAYGNGLLKREGLSFSTYDCAIADLNGKENENPTMEMTAFKFELEDTRGAIIPFQLKSDDWNYPCGCAFDFPLLSVTDRQWTVLANGKPLNMKRPKDFYFEEVRLLDATKTKILRRWFKPTDIEPEAISTDGRKLYLYLDYSRDIGLYLEISENGTFRFVPKNTPNIIKNGNGIPNFESSIGFEGLKQFKTKTRNYYLTYNNVCT